MIHQDNSVTVIDDGRGIPVDEHPTEKRPAAEVVMTTLHAGGKFDDGGPTRCRAASTASACLGGERPLRALEVEIRRDGKVWRQTYRARRSGQRLRGDIGTTDKTGTRVTFHPDPRSSPPSTSPSTSSRSVSASSPS